MHTSPGRTQAALGRRTVLSSGSQRESSSVDLSTELLRGAARSGLPTGFLNPVSQVRILLGAHLGRPAGSSSNPESSAMAGWPR